MRNKVISVVMVMAIVMAMFTGCKKYESNTYGVTTGDNITVDFDSKGTGLTLKDNSGYPTVVDADGNAVLEIEFDTTEHGQTLINMLNDLVTSGVIHRTGVINGNEVNTYGFTEYTEGEYNCFMIIAISGTSTSLVVNCKYAHDDAINIISRMYFYSDSSKRPKSAVQFNEDTETTEETNG